MEKTLGKKLRGLPLKLKAGIDSGAELTASEWATQLGVKEGYIRRSLSRLRQTHGFHQYHPTGTKRGENGHQGVIVDIYSKQEYIEETITRQKTNYLDPQILAFSHWLETSYQKFPKLRPIFKAYLSDEMAKLTIMDENL